MYLDILTWWMAGCERTPVDAMNRAERPHGPGLHDRIGM